MSSRGLPRNVLVLSLVSLLTDASSEMIYPLLPVFLSSTLGSGAMAVGVMEGVAQATAALTQVVSGSWSDRMRRKPLVVAGYSIASVLRPLIGLATAAWQVVAIRVGDRIGKGIRGAPRDALIADSVDPANRGRAFGFHRAADHLGAVIGPVVAFVLLQWAGLEMRTVFLLAAVPAGAAVLFAALGIREAASRDVRPARGGLGAAPGGVLARYLLVMALFTLGNSTDAFLLLRARDAGVALAHLPLLWALLHVVKSLTSTSGGIWSDRLGRRPVIVAGWLVYAAVYLAFGSVRSAPVVWGLMAIYGIHAGLTEGGEKALVADLVPAGARGWAYGWFNLVCGLATLPASIMFGALWERSGARVAFTFGAAMATAAAALLWVFVRPTPVVER